MRFHYIGISVFFALLLFDAKISAQASFTIPDTICIDEPVNVENTSREADTYYWNFCSGNLIHDPEGEMLVNPGTYEKPAFIDFAEDNGNYYAFITNHLNGTLVRNSYGSNFLNTPVSENLGSFGGIIPVHVEGIQVVQEGSNWYVFIVGGQDEDSRLLRFEFGPSLTNNPAITNLGNTGDYMNYPTDLFITNDAGNWVGFTVCQKSNNLVRFNFGNSLTDPPVIEDLGNFGLSSPCGINPIMENGNWYIFVSNNKGNEITRLDFRGSLLSNPSAASIGDNSVLDHPFDLTIIRDCENTYGFVLNNVHDDIVRLVFNNGLDNPPEFTSLGRIGNLSNPHGISDVFRVGDTLYAFVANIAGSNITRLYFPGCDNANPASSADRNPPSVSYNTPGIYNINLVIDEGQTNQENTCRNIVVLDSADVFVGNDTLIAAGSTIELAPDSTYTSYVWTNDATGETLSTDRILQVNQPGVYALTITNQYGCVATDEMEVIVDIGIPNFFTPNNDGSNDSWDIPFLTLEPEADISVFDRFGNLLTRYKAGEGNWDGRCNGRKLPTGTYWYIIEVPGIGKPYKGSVTIKR